MGYTRRVSLIGPDRYGHMMEVPRRPSALVRRQPDDAEVRCVVGQVGLS